MVFSLQEKYNDTPAVLCCEDLKPCQTDKQENFCLKFTDALVDPPPPLTPPVLVVLSRASLGLLYFYYMIFLKFD